MLIVFIWTLFSIILIGRYDHTAEMQADVEYMETVTRFEKTVPCICVLLQIMTLDEWMDILNPIFQHHPWSYLYFLVYVSMGGFAMMNLVTATVLEVGMRHAAKEQFANEVDKQLAGIGDVHLLADERSGLVERRSFRVKWRKCRPLVKLLEIMCIFPEEAPAALDELFSLLDDR